MLNEHFRALRESMKSRQSGQAMLETVMTTAFLVAIAVVINKLLGPVLLDAVEKIGKALSSVGP